MRVVRLRLLVSFFATATIALLIGLIVPTGGKVMAQSGVAGTAGITIPGDCDDTDGSYSQQLVFPTFAESDLIGSAGSNPAAQSLSTVAVPITNLVQDESAIVVTDMDGDVLACGEIGGVLGADGSLVFGIDEVDRSGVMGIAYLAAAPDGVLTNVSLFLTGIEPASGASAARVAPEGRISVDQVTAAPTEEPAVATDFVAADLEYLEAVSDNLTKMAASVGRNGNLFINHRLDDPQWYAEVAAELATQDELYRQFNLLVPPPAFAEIHQLIYEAYTLTVLAGDDIELGLSTFDASYFESATVKITQAGTLMEEATVLINEMTAELLGD